LDISTALLIISSITAAIAAHLAQVACSRSVAKSSLALDKALEDISAFRSEIATMRSNLVSARAKVALLQHELKQQLYCQPNLGKQAKTISYNLDNGK